MLSEDEANFFAALIPSKKAETADIDLGYIRGFNACRAQIVKNLNKHI